MGLSTAERAELWDSVNVSMFHFECQKNYGTERESLARWLANPDSVQSLRANEPSFDRWLTMVARHTKAGITVSRCRIIDRPATDYQRFEQRFTVENLAAGELIWQCTRARAEQAGLLPAAGPADWWLLDEERVLVQPFNSDDLVTEAHLVTDPDEVAKYRVYRDLAIWCGTQMRLTTQR